MYQSAGSNMQKLKSKKCKCTLGSVISSFCCTAAPFSTWRKACSFSISFCLSFSLRQRSISWWMSEYIRQTGDVTVDPGCKKNAQINVYIFTDGWKQKKQQTHKQWTGEELHRGLKHSSRRLEARQKDLCKSMTMQKQNKHSQAQPHLHPHNELPGNTLCSSNHLPLFNCFRCKLSNFVRWKLQSLSKMNAKTKKNQQHLYRQVMNQSIDLRK